MRRILTKLVFIALVAGAPVAAGLFRVWVHHDAVQKGYDLSEEGGRRRELRREEQQLEVELAAERAPDRLVRLARQLGLGPPHPEQILASRDKDAKAPASTGGRDGAQ